MRLEITGSSGVFKGDTSRPKHGFDVAWGSCPECDAFIVLRREGRYGYEELDEPQDRMLMDPYDQVVLFPPGSGRRVEREVPSEVRREFLEAAAVLPISPKASAALSRRILQHILRSATEVRPSTLAAEIEEFTKRSGVPSQLAEALDAVRRIGNVAAHPLQSQRSEIVDVEPGEAEWLLEALDALLDFVYVQPQRLASRKAALESKLGEVRRR